ncbi:unnamed protein product [Enterobius vermicularis]|uniref:Transmembrane protein n=1 Tax=Enterobius vermicularis TaxID=51028 RepID=A0A0N4V0K5_ENTVE|nr:unnamed protein product [Enterobius vermicularis]
MSPELKCSHKFDLAAQSALDSVIEDGEVSAKELQLHRILPQHKAVLVLSTFTLIFGVVGITFGLLSVCSKLCALFYGTLLFISASCSGLADLVFLLAAARINIRYVPGIVDIYEQRLGYAVIFHAGASLVLFFSFFVSVISGCLLVSPNSLSKRRYYNSDYCHCQSPELRAYQKNPLHTVLEAQDEFINDDLSESKEGDTSPVSLL